MFECIQVLFYGWTLPQGPLVFLKNTFLYNSSVHKSCVRGGRSRRGFFSSNTPSYSCECIQVLCYGWTLPQFLFSSLQNTALFFLVYTSLVIRVDAPAGDFCFLLSCIQVLCYRWTLPQGLFVVFKTLSYIFEYIQVLCYGRTLPQGLFVISKKHVLYV